MSKRIWIVLFSTLVVVSMLLSACGGAEPTTSTSAEAIYLVLSEDNRLFINACVEALSYTHESEDWKMQTCINQYAEGMNEMTLDEYQQAIGLVNATFYVVPLSRAPELALPSLEMLGPALITAGFTTGLVTAYLVTTTPEYQAKMASFEVALPTTRVMVPEFKSLDLTLLTTTTQVTSGQMIDLSVSFELTDAAKKVAGAYAYWETDQHDPNKCFFGIHTPFSWAANTVDGNCPEGPDDEAGIARLIEKLWKSFTTGHTWAEMIAMGGKAAGHVLAIIEVAKAYGVTLIP